MVNLARYRGRDNFVDPFCGSGTIAIEAAMIAKNRAPGLSRSFSCQKWDISKPELWQKARSEALDKEFHGDYHIYALSLIHILKILSGEAALENIPYELHALEAHAPLLLSDQGLKQVGAVDTVLHAIAPTVPKAIFTDIPADSSVAVVNQCAARR